MTSSPTVAISAAVLGVPFTITFSGQTVFQYVADVAATLIAASRSSRDGAHVFNLAGQPVDIGDWVATVESIVPEAAGLLRVAPVELPFPAEIDHAALAALGPIPETPVRVGIEETVEIFRRLAGEGRLVSTDQGLPSET
jgi:nucleoside-diphosphate-sugar epimerase